jgi:hypothetical protein
VQLTKVVAALKRAETFFKQHRDQIITALMICVIALAAAPQTATHAQSFSVNTGDLLTSAADIFNGLWPVFAIVAGLGLGIALVRFIVNAIRSAF